MNHINLIYIIALPQNKKICLEEKHIKDWLLVPKQLYPNKYLESFVIMLFYDKINTNNLFADFNISFSSADFMSKHRLAIEEKIYGFFSNEELNKIMEVEKKYFNLDFIANNSKYINVKKEMYSLSKESQSKNLLEDNINSTKNSQKIKI